MPMLKRAMAEEQDHSNVRFGEECLKWHIHKACRYILAAED